MENISVIPAQPGTVAYIVEADDSHIITNVERVSVVAWKVPAGALCAATPVLLTPDEN